jgi:hypothetical protein
MTNRRTDANLIVAWELFIVAMTSLLGVAASVE